MKVLDLRHCDMPPEAVPDDPPEFAAVLASIEREPVPERLVELAVRLQSALAQRAVISSAKPAMRRNAAT